MKKVKGSYMPMQIEGTKYSIAFTSHIFEYRNGQKRKGDITKANIRELIRASVAKNSDILTKDNFRYVITYPRENDCFSAILVSKENNIFVVITIVHNEKLYQRMGILPNEKNSVDLNEEETQNAFMANIPKVSYEKKIPLRRKIRKVSL